MSTILSKAELEAYIDRLEAELSQLKSRLSLAQHHAIGRHGDYTRALEENGELRKDRERLIDVAARVLQPSNRTPLRVGVDRAELRELIDAARTTSTKETKP